MVRERTLCWLVITVALLGLVGRTSAAEVRTVSGVLVEPRTQAPIVGQKLALDRPPGDYTSIPFAMFIFGIPQPATIATAVTDQSGRFQFRTTKDRGRFLEIRIAGSAPADFRSRAGYAATHLSDSLYPDKPFVSFHAHIMHNPRGGFMPVPAATPTI